MSKPVEDMNRDEMLAKIAELQERTERAECQLAGCGAAALGWNSGHNLAKKGDWGWSASYQDVLNLRVKYEELLKEHKELIDTL